MWGEIYKGKAVFTKKTSLRHKMTKKIFFSRVIQFFIFNQQDPRNDNLKKNMYCG